MNDDTAFTDQQTGRVTFLPVPTIGDSSDGVAEEPDAVIPSPQAIDVATTFVRE